MFQRWRETRSHWNLPHCTKHLSPHSTLHSLSLYQLAAIAYSANIHLCLPLWKIFLKWACPSICPCVTQLYLHKVSFSCIIREEIISSPIFSQALCPFLHRSRVHLESKRAFVKKSHQGCLKDLWDGVIGGGWFGDQNTERGTLTLRQLHLFQQLSCSLIRAELLGCVLRRVNWKFSLVTKSCVF